MLFPAVAMLVGAGVAEPPITGRWLALARGLCWCIPPALGLLGLVAAAYGAGFDPAAPFLQWLREDDRAGATTLAAVTGAHAAPLSVLAITPIAAAIWLGGQIRAQRWQRLVTGLAALMVAWVALFDGLLHPAIARGRSVRDFMLRVAAVVPAEQPLHAFYPPDPGLRFYVPRALRAWPAGGTAEPAFLLLWEDEWRRLRDAQGATLPPAAVSEAQQPGRGHLVLLATPGGPLRRVPLPEGDRPAGLHAPR